jgi:hypothetical protein
MTAYEILDQIIANGYTCSRIQIDEYFYWVATADLADQIELELTPNDYGTEYTMKNGMIIRIIEATE